MTKKQNKYVSFQVGDTIYKTTTNKMHRKRKAYSAPDKYKLRAFIPGTILDIAFKIGDKVKEGDIIMYLEAMKMKNIIKAPFDGEIKKIYVEEGTVVARDELLVVLK